MDAATRAFQSILNECIDRILVGESLELCLKRHPLHRQELEPLLKIAIILKNALSFEPPAEARKTMIIDKGLTKTDQ